VQNTAEQLRAQQPVIGTAVARGELQVVAAEYHLSTGLVTLLERDSSVSAER
jgi:carbonic anhydrase